MKEMQRLIESDAAFILLAVETLSALCFDPTRQAQVVDLVLSRFQSAKAADLPGVVKFLAQHATGPAAKEVAVLLREGLHFVNRKDPRLTVPDLKMKGRAPGGGEGDPEALLLAALRQGLQLNPAAADALFKEIKGETDPPRHRAFDFWALLLLHGLGSERRKAAEMLFSKKFAAGHARVDWMERALEGHEGAMAPFLPLLLTLAQRLLQTTTPDAGGALYAACFARFVDACSRQEVLRALHSHLGPQDPLEASAALDVLKGLAQHHTAALSRHAAFLTALLDHVDSYSDSQLHQVFAILSELVVGACFEQDGGGGSSSGGGRERSRLEDELFIFLRKQLSGASSAHRRVGVVGVVSLVQRLGEAAASATAGGSCSAAVDERFGEAAALLDRTFEDCARSPESFALLCDELAKGAAQGVMPRRLMMDLQRRLTTRLEETFVADARGQFQVLAGGAEMVAADWGNLDGADGTIAVPVLPLAAAEASGSSGIAAGSGPLRQLFGVMRLVAALSSALTGGLDEVDALLGCPVTLFDMVGRDSELPAN
jgi:fanconi anemia group D2 protein